MDLLFKLNKIIELRHKLHQYPELSGMEVNTAKTIVSFLSQYKSFELIEGIGGNGVACIIKGKEDGPSVLFRCDMDALPINEENTFDYISRERGVSHKCGHDGHMAIMAGLADAFFTNPPLKGQAVLLFQPAEETGHGASRIINDEKFNKINIDYVFALHNMPGYSEGEIVLRNNIFASASTGMIIKLYGKSSHAAEPEKGINPAEAMADIIKGLSNLSKKHVLLSDFGLLTIIYARVGETAFGTSPGYAEVMATLRTSSDKDMTVLQKNAEELITQISKLNHLKFEISYTEEFPATVNNIEQVKNVEEAAKSNNIKYTYLDKPVRWSEDFAYFTMKYPGVLFGLGSGVNHPRLHNPDYDFPDRIINNGVKMFYEIFNHIVNIS